MASTHTSAQRAVANLPIALIPTGYANAGAGYRLHRNAGRERCQDIDAGSGFASLAILRSSQNQRCRSSLPEATCTSATQSTSLMVIVISKLPLIRQPDHSSDSGRHRRSNGPFRRTAVLGSSRSVTSRTAGLDRTSRTTSKGGVKKSKAMLSGSRQEKCRAVVGIDDSAVVDAEI